MPIFPKVQTVPDPTHWAKLNKTLQSEALIETVASFKNSKSASIPQELKEREGIERKKKIMID